MSIVDILISAVVVAALFILFKYAGRLTKKLPAETVKTLNWAGFIAAIAFGTLWYFMPNPILMFLTLSSVVVYFIFYDYNSSPPKE